MSATPNRKSELSVKDTQSVTRNDLTNIRDNASDLSKKAMELTDAWGVMFILDEGSLRKIASAIGFSEAVCAGLYEQVCALKYVAVKGKGEVTDRPVITWHAADATFLTMRGAIPLASSMASVRDDNVESYIVDNSTLFDKIMNDLPEYSRYQMFSPEAGAQVLATFGAKVTPDRLFELASKYGVTVTEDLEGRRGVTAQFIRSLTTTLSAKV